MINKKSFVYDKLTGATPIAVNIYDNRLEYQRFLDLMQSMLMEYENDFPYKDEYLMNALENLLIITFRMEKDDSKNGKSSNTVAKHALIFIQKNFRRNIGLNSIARELHTSPNYLSSAFHKSYSKTVVSYINDMRLNYASNALRTDSAVSITDVCFECGYKTYSHFLKDFGKKFGISPKVSENAQILRMSAQGLSLVRSLNIFKAKPLLLCGGSFPHGFCHPRF